MRILYMVSDEGAVIGSASMPSRLANEFVSKNTGYVELSGSISEPIDCYRVVNGELQLKDNWRKIKESLNEHGIPISEAGNSDNE